MIIEHVKVIFYAGKPHDNRLEFSLIFSDGYEKYYNLDDYAIRHYRGANERDIIQQCALDYFDQNGQHVDIIKLIFL